jgi:hypothetical protein
MPLLLIARAAVTADQPQRRGRLRCCAAVDIAAPVRRRCSRCLVASPTAAEPHDPSGAVTSYARIRSIITEVTVLLLSPPNNVELV